MGLSGNEVGASSFAIEKAVTIVGLKGAKGKEMRVWAWK